MMITLENLNTFIVMHQLMVLSHTNEMAKRPIKNAKTLLRGVKKINAGRMVQHAVSAKMTGTRY